MGLYADALSRFDDSVAAAKAAHDDLALASAQINAGNIYFLVGKVGQAERAYSEGLRVYDEMGDESGEAAARINLGNYYRQAGEYEKALAQYRQSLAIGSQIGNRLVELSSVNGIGRVNLLKGDYDDAKQEFERGLAMAREIGSRGEEAGAMLELGYLSVVTGHDDEGLSDYTRARELALLTGDTDTLFRCDNFIGDIYLKHERWVEAAAAYKSAVDGVESLRAHMQAPLLQPAFFEQFTSPYRNLAWIAFRSEDSAGAYEISERAKARTLVDIMRSGRVLGGAASAAERSEEQAQLDKIGGMEGALEALKADGSADTRPFKEQLAVAYADYERFTTNLLLRHRELRVRRARFKPVGLEEVNRSLFAGRPGLRVLSYLITERGILLLVLSPGGDGARAKLSSHLISGADGKDLRAQVIDIRLKCSKPSGPYRASARRLYEMLVAPAAEELKGATDLVIVPDGLLHTLPFQALLDGDGKHLIERYGVSYAPSVTALREMMKLSDGRRSARRALSSASGMLAMGVSTFGDTGRRRAQNLPWAGEQVQEVAALFGTKGYTDASSTEARAKLLMTRMRFVHFVTHGEVNQESPMFSTVVLKKSRGEDGLLYAREIAGLHLRAELVTLAACETALGQETQGEGLLGLSWALFVAGVPSSVLTQWQVQDTSTNRLMLAFYRRLKETGFKDKAGALRYAQKSLIESKEFAHPYYWAPVILTGDWR
jgi:CHAT domain-containing protein/tetratricopeptide (TPR) repeat protein